MRNTLDMLLDAAVLLSQNGSVKDRLADAFLAHLTTLEPAQLPESYRAPFRSMCEALRRERPLPRENPVRASVRKMSTEEAGQYAALVVRLYAAVARGGNVTPLARQPGVAPVKLHAVRMAERPPG
jgi:hypothetical protein